MRTVQASSSTLIATDDLPCMQVLIAAPSPHRYAELHKRLRKGAVLSGSTSLPAIRPRKGSATYSAAGQSSSTSTRELVREAIAAEREAKHELLVQVSASECL